MMWPHLESCPVLVTASKKDSVTGKGTEKVPLEQAWLLPKSSPVPKPLFLTLPSHPCIELPA